jgi:hypothetical protein
MIRFGVTGKDPSFCDADSFSYKGTNDTTASNSTYWKYTVESLQGATVLDTLVAEFWLLDNDGTINVEFTTQADFDAGKTILYRPPQPEYYNKADFNKQDVTKSLGDFMKITENPFQYQYYQDTTNATSLLWSSNSAKLYFSQYMLMDAGIFTLNSANNEPLIGMGEKFGSVFYRNENNGVHSKYTYDAGNPYDDGMAPGKNYYGYQPFYAYQSVAIAWVGVFDVSSYATDYIINSKVANTNEATKTFNAYSTQVLKVTIGGTINKFFF